MKKLLLSLLFITGLHAAHAAVDTVKIDSIQFVSASDLSNCIDLSSFDGDTVFTSGIIIVDGEKYGSTSHNIFLCQSSTYTPFGCIQLRSNFSANYSTKMCDLYEGDSVHVLGYVNQYQGETQITPLERNDAIQIYKSNVKFSTVKVNAGDLNDNSRNNNLVDGEKYEGALARLSDLEVVSVDPFSNRVSFVVKDINGNQVNISDYFLAQKTPAYSVNGGCHTSTKNGTFTPPSVGDKFDSIAGIIVHSKNNCTGNNGRGYEMHPYNANHYAYGPAAPRISNFKRSHAAPKSTDVVTISADVIDLDGTVVKVELYWATGTNLSSSFTTVPMVASGNNYAATIAAQGDGTFVRYYIMAEDNLGNKTYRPSSDPTANSAAYRVRDNGLKIYDIQYTPFSSGNSIFRDQEVTVTGIVTASGDLCDLSVVHMQDEGSNSAWSGIEVTQPGTQLKKGEKIRVTGVVMENFGGTQLRANNVTKDGIGTTEPVYITPDSVSSYDFVRNEKYEGMLVGLINPTTVGGGKLHVVDTNADSGSGNNYAEWVVGRDPLDPSSGCRILTGRDGLSSIYVSYVNASNGVKDPLGVEKLIVSDTISMDTVIGIMYYSFSNMKLLPRNNRDFKGINAKPSTQEPCAKDDTANAIAPSPFELRNQNFLVFPNPAQDVINLRNFSKVESIEATVYDITGKAVAGRNTKLREDVINVAHLEAGTYILNITTPDGELLDYRKLVIQ
ncbi:MAG: T9SS type A sorting domain-containing protein [Flavobacteriales bacterium]|nr:T9SS type A sorting domain-containing protein [Flavobacteriales bacterium]